VPSCSRRRGFPAPLSTWGLGSNRSCEGGPPCGTELPALYGGPGCCSRCSGCSPHTPQLGSERGRVTVFPSTLSFLPGGENVLGSERGRVTVFPSTLSFLPGGENVRLQRLNAFHSRVYSLPISGGELGKD